MANPPKPIATAVTSSDGTFHFRSLPPGRYFITVVQPSGGVSGSWVEVSVDRGAALVLILCLDCPVPV
jgi:hypothetical protein